MHIPNIKENIIDMSFTNTRLLIRLSNANNYGDITYCTIEMFALLPDAVHYYQTLCPNPGRYE